MLRLQKLFHSKIAPWYLDPVLFSRTMRINLDPLNFSHGPWILESSLFGTRGGGTFVSFHFWIDFFICLIFMETFLFLKHKLGHFDTCLDKKNPRVF